MKLMDLKRNSEIKKVNYNIRLNYSTSVKTEKEITETVNEFKNKLSNEFKQR
ncbi:hypothetical protein [Clostridium ihumii]|uniref:hypothetical protein n=1 Tax=Clostridium ihumii TaxID=1470356 RepID=UPI000B1B06C4|nr:hypothetical protein [Clostridium ihumii]